MKKESAPLTANKSPIEEVSAQVWGRRPRGESLWREDVQKDLHWNGGQRHDAGAKNLLSLLKVPYGMFSIDERMGQLMLLVM